ncbi:phosphoglycerate mutase-like protein [Lepidopterella palustris CBS 459.81]|uniref:Phosphoglycerate mutase-like protein n=1 Tax=Lepidopterella palustris CBS 459.81 TaxID=1314670 RepID=A0A8E2E0K2_9PEZI|nr:phosphoglycerate mutase-like protein [Lepidopterella palustris CBS 459.81]
MRSDTSLNVPSAPQASHIKYTTIKGYFLQSEDSTDSSTFNFKTNNFGLINRSYETDGSGDAEVRKTQWQRFVRYVEYVNEESGEGVWFKVLFMGRHGQGWHNVAEDKYGTPAWDCYWSKLDGADGITWADADLTELGEKQAEGVSEFWKSHLTVEGGGIPVPQSYYLSPLTRAIRTAEITFAGLELPESAPFKPVVKELLREAIGVHTCDRRSTATHILGAFSSSLALTLEPHFSETDPLWTADLREPDSALKVRMATLLDDVFTHDDSAFVSFTSHSGAIGMLLEALGHRKWNLQTGEIIPVFVRAERVSGEREEGSEEPSGTAPSCTTMIHVTGVPPL